MAEGVATYVDRLQRAVDAHDLDALAQCFAETYRNETPVHPSRSFEGRDQVRANWKQIFAGLPDIRADVLRTSVDGDVVWTEWEMRGTRPDGAAHVMRGVVIFGIVEGQASWARFYLEPVDAGADGVDAAVARFASDAAGGPA